MAFTQTYTLESLAAKFNGQASAIGRLDHSRPLSIIAQLVLADIKRNFDAARAPSGKPWAPLKWRRGGHPLKDTGLLASANTVRQHQGGLIASNNMPQAAVHQFGHTFNRAARSRSKPWVFTTAKGQKVFTRKIKAYRFTVPARPFMGWSANLITRTLQVLGEFWERQVVA